jgi:hypothetical protein
MLVLVVAQVPALIAQKLVVSRLVGETQPLGLKLLLCLQWLSVLVPLQEAHLAEEEEEEANMELEALALGCHSPYSWFPKPLPSHP